MVGVFSKGLLLVGWTFVSFVNELKLDITETPSSLMKVKRKRKRNTGNKENCPRSRHWTLLGPRRVQN